MGKKTMATAGERFTSMGKKTMKLAIEDYLDFLGTRTLELTASQLRQIVAIHGFKKREFSKTVLFDMISTINLMDLRRSTLLDDGVSGDARLTLEEAINDLKGLDWQECHITSLLTQDASVRDFAPAASKRKRVSKGLTKRPNKSGAANSVVSGGTTVAEESTTDGLAYPGSPLSRKSPCFPTNSASAAV